MKININQPLPLIKNSSFSEKKKEPVLQPEDKVSIAGNEGDKNKLVLLQLDGLSKPALERAMKRGDVPNLKALIEKSSYVLRSYNCGISPITYAIVSSILYGVEIPGNQWYDKENGVMIDPLTNEDFIKREAEKRGEKSLVEDGVVYSSPWSGGAKDVAGVMSSFKKSLKDNGFIKTVVKEAKKDISLLKKGDYSLTRLGWNMLKGMFRVMKQLVKDGNYNFENKFAPGLTSMNEHVMPQVATEGVKNAIENHEPVVYVDYVGYDCASHYCGSSSDEAENFLKELDKLIGDIVKKADESKDNYNVIIFSDHGHTSVKTFEKIYGKSASDAVKDMASLCNPHGYKDGDIEFAHEDTMGNIYFTGDKNTVDIKTIEKNFPGYTNKLVNHPAIGLVVTRDDRNYVLTGKEGSLIIDEKGKTIKSSGKNPLNHFGDEALIRKHMVNYMALSGTGDIVIFGEYDGKKVVDFGDAYLASAHGGLGGEQSMPFIMTPSALPLATGEINEATDFHNVLKEIKEGKTSLKD